MPDTTHTPTSAPFNRFEHGQTVIIDEVEYMPRGYVMGRLDFYNPVRNASFVCPDADNIVGMPTDVDFSRLLLEGRAKIKSPKSQDRVRLMNDAAQWTRDQALKVDPGVEKMLAQVELLDEKGTPNGDKAILRCLTKHWDAKLAKRFGPADPTRTIRRWRATRGRAGHRHASQMVRLRGVGSLGSRGPDVPAQLAWKHAFSHYADATDCTVADTYSAYTAELKLVNEGKHPTHTKPAFAYNAISERTMRRRIIDLECSATDGARRGKQAIEQDWAGGGKPLTAEFAMQKVIIDHTRLNAFAVDDELEMVLGRPWLTLAIDVKTRAIVAYLLTFHAPSNWHVGEILRRMALPKLPPLFFAERYPILRDLRGRAVEVIVDNAPEFRSHMTEAASRGIGTAVTFCPVKKPRYRAIGERPMATIVNAICKLIPGRTISIGEARRLGHDAQDTACVMFHEMEAIAAHVVAEYNVTPHDGLQNRQPALMFAKDASRFGINNVADMDEFRIETMEVHEGAQLSPSGIRAFANLRYADKRAVKALLDDLRPLEARRKRSDDATAIVDYRYCPQDIGAIYVWNRKSRQHVRLECDEFDYANGLPEWLHDLVRKKATDEGKAFNTKEERLAARARLITATKQISEKAEADKRMALAKLYEVPRLRQIAGNIVDKESRPAEAVTLDEFLPNNLAAKTALDTEILSPRGSDEKPHRRENLRARRDARDAGREAVQTRQGGSAAAPAPRRVTVSRAAK